MHEGHNCSYVAEHHQELYGAVASVPTILPGFALPRACPWHPRQAFHLCCSFAIHLMVSVTAPGSRQQWEVQNSFLAPPGNVGEVLSIHLACVEASRIWLYVRHLHPRAAGAAQASCPILRSHISNYLPQDSSSACRSA